MTHSFDSGFVRIFRTPFCRVPPPLSSMNTSTSSTPPPILPRKIMRRGEDGELAPASAGPSKPTSEVGSDARDKAPPVVYASWPPSPCRCQTLMGLLGCRGKQRRKRTTKPENASLGAPGPPRPPLLVCRQTRASVRRKLTSRQRMETVSVFPEKAPSRPRTSRTWARRRRTAASERTTWSGTRAASTSPSTGTRSRRPGSRPSTCPPGTLRSTVRRRSRVTRTRCPPATAFRLSRTSRCCPTTDTLRPPCRR